MTTNRMESFKADKETYVATFENAPLLSIRVLGYSLPRPDLE